MPKSVSRALSSASSDCRSAKGVGGVAVVGVAAGRADAEEEDADAADPGNGRTEPSCIVYMNQLERNAHYFYLYFRTVGRLARMLSLRLSLHLIS
jgi:hypothetical protein